MNIKIYPSKVEGTVTAPPSKSVTHRAIILASLARGKSVIKNALIADDTLHTINALSAFGVDIKQEDDTLTITGTGGNLKAPKTAINLGNSGTSMRLLTAVAALAKGKTILTGSVRLKQRPINDLLHSLRTLGISAISINYNGCPPIEIIGGQIKGGKVKITASLSSQFVSALLLIAPFAKKETEIIVDGLLRSKPYVDLTIQLMERFGVRVHNDNHEMFVITPKQTYLAQEYKVESDYSSAGYFFAAAAVAGGSVTVRNLNAHSAQGDKYLLEILGKMGCTVKKDSDKVTVGGTKKPRAVSVDMADYPDIVQTVASVAAYAEGETNITNIGHLSYKETDRIANTALELKNLGINTTSTKNSLTIKGGEVRGGVVNTHNDHRMAMSMAVASLGAKEPTVIKNADVVSKSYPNYFEDLKKIGVKMEVLS